MRSRRLKSVLPSALAALCLFLGALPALAGNPTFPGSPFVWPNGGRNIPFITDQGGLGPMSNAEAVAQTIEAFRRWEEIPTATATYVHAGSLPFDVNETNFLDTVFPLGSNPIIYDEDGAIIELLYGSRSGLLGFAFVNQFGDKIEFAMVVLNGCWLDSAVCGRGGVPVPTSHFLDIQVHEIGHFSGLDHSVVNSQLLPGANIGPGTPSNPFPPSPVLERQEVMSPFAARVREDIPQADDRAIFSTLYPEADFFANSGTITGRVLGSTGRPLNGVNVIARNIANPIDDAVSSISGSVVLGRPIPPDDPDPFTGVYTLNGLTPGAQYAVYIEQLPRGGQFSSTVPLFPLPGPKEFYNGADESNNPDTDDPSAFTALTVTAGNPLTGINIIFNRPRPGPILLFPGTFVELPLPFPFAMCGQNFDSVFVNSDGSLTFGQGASLGSFRVRLNHLGGPPRIAGLLANLNLSSPRGEAPGVVAFEETGDTFTVTFTGLREFPTSGTNTFAITLFAGQNGEGNRYTVSYGQLAVQRGLAGYSCGERITSGFEQETDLSALAGRMIRGSGQTAVFEEFTNSDNDLDSLTLSFELPGAFADAFEPNDSLAAARRVTLPFRTTESFTEIHTGDVDYYRFHARAGEILVADNLHPNPVGPVLYPLVSLYQVTGDGPGSATGTLLQSSLLRMIFTVPADAEYALAVTTDPDSDFTGENFGRYLLTVNTYRGRVLQLGDDDTVELPLPFRFHFQANDWNSVWVNSNGNLTFGTGDTSRPFNPLGRFRSGPPRIAPFFADLDPTGSAVNGFQGVVLAEEKHKSLTVHWVMVGGLPFSDSNTFSVTIDDEGHIRMAWDFIDPQIFRAVVGITEGNGVALPPTDLSEVRNGSASGTTYEEFDAVSTRDFLLPFDLSFDDLKFFKRDRFILRPYEVSGQGAAGSLSYEVRFDYSGPFSAQPHGLTPADTEVATVEDDPENNFFSARESGVGITTHTVEIPLGTVHARFALFDEHTDGNHDLDLFVLRPDGQFSVSGSPTSTEEVSFDSPVPGTYTVFVHGYETDGPAASYTLFSWVLGTGSGDAGNLAITTPPQARTGETGTVNVSWSGLQPGTKYLGIITHHSKRQPSDYFDEFLGHTLLRVDP